MHYFNFHIGDYKSHTHHLSLIEDLAYRRLLDLYYLSEKPIVADQAARLIGMREHGHEVLCVLMEFFEETDKGFVNKRADAEIEAYYARIEQASKAGKASAKARKNSSSTPVERQLNSELTDSQPTSNHKPVTSNHKNLEQIPASPEPVGSTESDEPAKVVFGLGMSLLPEANPKAARSLLGKLRKECGDEAALSILSAMDREKPIEPMAWLAAAINARKNKQPHAGTLGGLPTARMV